MIIVLNLILMWPLKIGGLALATSIAGIFNFQPAKLLELESPEERKAPKVSF